MVALVVGLVVILAAGLYYVSEAQSTVVANQTGMLQEDGRIAMDLIARDVRAAGDFGCSDPTQMVNALNSTVLNVAQPVMGLAAGTPAPSGNTALWGAGGFAALNATSDVLVLSGGAGKVGTLSQAMASPSDSLTVTTVSTPFAPNDLAIVSDCTNSTLFQVSGTSNSGALLHATGGTSPGNSRADLGWTFGAGAEVVREDTRWLAVGQPAGKPLGLWRYSGQDNTMVLISPRVVNMKVQYLVDTTGSGVGDTLMSAASVTSWTNVRGVRVSLLMRSSQKALVHTPMTYVFAGQTTTAPDTYWYLPLDETVMLRNPAGGSS